MSEQINKGGRPPDPRRHYYRTAYGLSEKQVIVLLTPKFLDQLDRCATEEARRILLGKSR